MNVIMTATGIRHLEFADRLMSSIPDSLVITEEKKTPIEIYLEEYKTFKPSKLETQLCCKSINSSVILRLLESLRPDFIFTFGCSLLKKNLISTAVNGCINIHTGLTQFYRGVDSTTWALFNKDFDRIGATVHYITPGIDDGDIIAQAVTSIEGETSVEQLFLKTCTDGFNLLMDNLKGILEGTVTKTGLLHKGKLFEIKDMTSSTKESALKNLREYNELSRRLSNHN